MDAYGANDEDSAELRKLLLEVVRISSYILMRQNDLTMIVE